MKRTTALIIISTLMQACSSGDNARIEADLDQLHRGTEMCISAATEIYRQPEMEALTKAGLIDPSGKVTTYGKKFLKPRGDTSRGRLNERLTLFCYGELKSRVAKVKEVPGLFGTKLWEVKYTLSIENKADWANDPAVLGAFPEIQQRVSHHAKGGTLVKYYEVGGPKR